MADADQGGARTFDRRDPARVAEVLSGWLSERFGEAVQVENLVAPSGAGFSNETYLFDARVGSEVYPLVAQVGPQGEGIFPVYDLPVMAWVQHRLRSVSSVPVAKIRYVEADPGLLGASFYVMDRVQGQVPPDSPPYHLEGVLAGMDPARRAQAWWSGVDAMVALHTVGPGQMSMLADAPWGMPMEAAPARARLAQWRAFLDWAGGEPAPAITEGLDELARHLPEPLAPVPHWGDAKISNCVIGADGAVAAVLDWELCGLSDPYEDLAHWLMIDWVGVQRAEGIRLEGLPNAEATVAYYAKRTETEPVGLAWWFRFALVRLAIIYHRILVRMRDLGHLPGGTNLAEANTIAALVRPVMTTAGLPA